MPKIGVYAIALNEADSVERWATSAKDADVILLADTGSKDDTAKIARRLKVKVITANVVPWRFDMARNAALTALPPDLDWCIALDLDEILIDGWREALEGMDTSVTRPAYLYTWSWNPDDSPALQYHADKIHARKGYRWNGPVHELCLPYGDQKEVRTFLPGFEIHHQPDLTKPRGQYLPLLAMAVKEDPHDTRRAFWYARDLLFAGQRDESAKEFRRYLGLPGAWHVERSRAQRYLAVIYPEKRLDLLRQATREAPDRREPWVELANHHYKAREWQLTFDAIRKALAIPEAPLDYLTEAEAWGWKPHEYAYMSLWQLKRYDEAIEHATTALKLSEGDERIQNNLTRIQDEAAKAAARRQR